MKTAPAAVTSYLASLTGTTPPSFRADLVKVTLLDATVLRWTTADADLVVGGSTYTHGVIKRRGNRHDTSQLQVDGLELQLLGPTLLSGVSLVLRAMQGYFDDARVQVDHLVGASVANAIANAPVQALCEGRVAGVDPAVDIVNLGLASDIEQLAVVQLPKFFYVPACMHAVYDPNCGLSKAAFTLAGAASGVPTTTTIPTTSAALTAKAAGYFNGGVLVVTSGALTGARRSVKTWTANTFTLALPLTAALVAGDTFTVYPGCARTKVDCGPPAAGKFSNLINFRGFVHMPADEGAR
jgi:uncharacterized phage protein (TIGR02218 family)